MAYKNGCQHEDCDQRYTIIEVKIEFKKTEQYKIRTVAR